MKIIAFGLLATALTTAIAEEIPQRQIRDARVSNHSVILSSQSRTWQVMHECDLFVTESSLIDVRPLRRSSELDSDDRLVIIVDDERHVCEISSINRI